MLKIARLVFIIVGSVLFSCSDSGTNIDDNNDNQLVGEEAPSFSLASLDNRQISLSDFDGQVLYIFFIGYN